MMSAIMTCLGWILTFLYSIVNNYGVAIILFTILIKLILFPLDIKQKRSMAKTQKIQPLLNEVQKKYANDKEKLSQETMKLYKKYGISPMSGCLPMLIQLPIIFSLFYVVKKPLIYMAGVDFDETWRIAQAYNTWFDAIKNNPDIFGQLPKVLQQAGTLTVVDNNTFGLYEIQVAEVLANTRLAELSEACNVTPILQNPLIANYWTDGLQIIHFDFIGMNLAEEPSFTALFGLLSGVVPSTGTMLLWLIPVASGLSAFASTKVNSIGQPKQDKNVILAENEKPQEKGAGSEAMSSMSKIMPIFSLVFAFTLPAGVGLYWTVSNLIQIAQFFIVKNCFKTDITLEEIEGEMKNAKNRKNRKKSR